MRRAAFESTHRDPSGGFPTRTTDTPVQLVDFAAMPSITLLGLVECFQQPLRYPFGSFGRGVSLDVSVDLRRSCIGMSEQGPCD